MEYSGYNPLCLNDESGCANVCGDAKITATGAYVSGPKQSCNLEEPISITSYAAGSPEIATHLGAVTRFDASDFVSTTVTPILTFSNITGNTNMCEFISNDSTLDQAGAWQSESFNAEISRSVVCARCKKTPECVTEASDLSSFDNLINTGCCVVRPCDTTDQNDEEKFVQYYDSDDQPVYASTNQRLGEISERVVFGDDASPIVVCGATKVAPVATATRWQTEVSNLQQ